MNTLFCSFSTRATNSCVQSFLQQKEKSFFSPNIFSFSPEVGILYVYNVRALLRRVSRVRERERKDDDDDDDDELFDNDDDDDENNERFVDDEE